MVVVQIKRELMPQDLVTAHSLLEQAFLDVARQVRPEPKGTVANDLRKSCRVPAHG
jgi:hypothetical protein